MHKVYFKIHGFLISQFIINKKFFISRMKEIWKTHCFTNHKPFLSSFTSLSSLAKWIFLSSPLLYQNPGVIICFFYLFLLRCFWMFHKKTKTNFFLKIISITFFGSINNLCGFDCMKMNKISNGKSRMISVFWFFFFGWGYGKRERMKSRKSIRTLAFALVATDSKFPILILSEDFFFFWKFN